MTTTVTLDARKTNFSKIKKDDALNFVKENHSQGLAKPGAGFQSFGLSYQNELVAVAIFCNPRTKGMQRRYTTELFRLAFKKDVRIRGGASKLIKNFLIEVKPFNLFTYQDTLGEVTDVYEHAGLTLVKENKTKGVLVKNGLSYAKAKNNWRDWISLEQATRRGPDALLGTNLGEILREDGTRISNIQLFLEYCDYHLEEIPGDRVYEWHNPDVSFYTYKITSIVDNNYYIGRKTIRLKNPTIQDCLKDDYFGSGGEKFKNWVLKIGAENLEKEILSIHKSWASVVSAEKREIGNSYSTDPFCMNSLPGGTGLGASVANFTKKYCDIHRWTLHNGDSCNRCSAAKVWSVRSCDIHGETKFRGENCELCKTASLYKKSFCDTHKEAVFRGKRCVSCTNHNSLSVKECENHGLVIHQGTTCSFCNAQKSVNYRVCGEHGYVKHQGETCCSCSAKKNVNEQFCKTHQRITTHIGKTCALCTSEASFSMKFCEKCGSETKHKGNTCATCTANKPVVMKICAVKPKEHGKTKHQGDVCNKCNAQKSVTVKLCVKYPKEHGLTKHQGDTCNKCNAQASVSMRWCEVHQKKTKHQGNKCSTCNNKNLIKEKLCETKPLEHGIRKHRGNTCYGCISDKRKVARRERETNNS